MIFCNRFAPLEGKGDMQEEEEEEEEKARLVQGQSMDPSAAKEARWRKWRPRTRARACHSKRRGAEQSLGWDALSLARPGAPPSLCPILALRLLTCVCVCVAARMLQWEPFDTRGQRPIPAAFKANAVVVRSSSPPMSSSLSHFH